jgi:dienelactone hydrolase
MLSRREMLALSAASVCPVCFRLARAADRPTDVLGGQKPADARLGPPKTLNDYFPFTPPKTKEEWAKRRQQVREQLLVALGLWPMPEKTPLDPVIHGKIERDGYTVEKARFASMPGHAVTGNLYRPTGDASGDRPAVLSPHGHWANGRFYEASDKEVEKQIQSGAEKTREGAKYPLQARCANLAKLGFVVFHYDMVGYADSTAIPHREGFKDAAAELRLQSFMGLQAWNSIRALDFLESLPGVDRKRIGVTGASGGGTQTFILCAIDDRPAAAFPAVMVSTAMQGGCVCENCSHLRVGTGNIEIAGLFAPKPLAMSAAKDWTAEIMTKGYPELKRLYTLLGAEDQVAARAWLEFGHNYAQPSREFMYAWFSKHLLGKDGPVEEQPFKPVPPKELSVYDAEHPRPKDELPADKLRERMTAASDARMAKLAPTDAKSLAEFRKVVGTALRAMVHDELPKEVAVRKGPVESKIDGLTMHRAVLGRPDEQDAVPAAGLMAPGFKGGRLVVWVHPQGKASLLEDGKVTPAVRTLIDAGCAVVAPDVFGVGELSLPKPYPVDKTFAGFTYGYNRSVLAQRVHDILTLIAFGQSLLKAKRADLVGWGEAGPWVVLAKALAGDAVTRTAADLNQFRFEAVTATDDPMMLPGAVKYGGLPAFLALCAPGAVLVHNHKGTSSGKLSKAAYAAAGAADKLTRVDEKLPPEKVVEWLVK